MTKLNDKLEYTKKLIQCWVGSWGLNGVAFAYSGGKDSTVLKHIIRSMYPRMPGVFSNTGLEYSEVVRMVKESDDVDIVRPKKSFKKVIEDHGWPVIDKRVARYVSDCQNASEKNVATVNLRMTGMTRAGHYAPSQKLSNCWRFLIDAPFKISGLCCDHLKKRPLRKYGKDNGIKWITGEMIEEGGYRAKVIKEHGCNVYNSKNPTSRPMAHWTTEDVWAYIREHNITYASVYDKGEKRTGCVFCMFAIMHDKDRFLRLKVNSPKQYEYVIDKLGAGEVLDYLGINY